MPGPMLENREKIPSPQLWKKKTFQGLGRSCLPIGGGGIVSVAP